MSDDWIVNQQSTTIVDGICVEVDDDFHINGTSATVCGGGGISIGNSSSNNTFNLQNGATTNQVCLNTNVYRGVWRKLYNFSELRYRKQRTKRL